MHSALQKVFSTNILPLDITKINRIFVPSYYLSFQSKVSPNFSYEDMRFSTYLLLNLLKPTLRQEPYTAACVHRGFIPRSVAMSYIRIIGAIYQHILNKRFVIF